jgi:DNA-binding CsgD family transcriptional regulator
MLSPQPSQTNARWTQPASITRQLKRTEAKLREILIPQKELEEEFEDESLEVKGLTAHERRVMIAEAVARLSPPQVECLRLAVKHQLAPTAIGRVLEVSPATVQNHLKRTLAKLQNVLGDLKIADLWGWQGSQRGSSLMGGHFPERAADRVWRRPDTQVEELRIQAKELIRGSERPNRGEPKA